MKENAKWFGAALVAGLVAGGGAFWFLSDKKADHPTPRQAVERMTRFGNLEELTGDAEGTVCHQIRVTADGGRTFRYLPRRALTGVDFRAMTPGQKMGLLRQAALEDVEGSDLAACVPVDEWFLSSPAYAQPKCLDCGGGCEAYGCPADLVIPYPNCFIPGPDCYVTTICCGSGCIPDCP